MPGPPQRPRPTVAFYTDAPRIGGAEQMLGMLLSSLDRSIGTAVIGVDPAVVEALAERRAGTHAVVVPIVSGKFDVAGFMVQARTFGRLRPRIFQANLNVPSSSQYALLAASMLPGVATVAVEHLPYPLGGRLQLRLKRFSSARLAAHVAVGDEVGRQVERFAALSPGSIRTIYNGVSDISLEPLPRPFQGPTLGAVGRLDRQKGFDVLLRAVAQVPEASLVIVGDGEERPALEQLSATLGLRQRVRFEGWRENARRYLTVCDAFVLPSRFEGLPLAIIEAMLASLPVVATRVGSVPEVVLDSETGVLVEPEDAGGLARALGLLVENAELRLKLGRAGRGHALRFTPSAMARAYELLYEEILS